MFKVKVTGGMVAEEISSTKERSSSLTRTVRKMIGRYLRNQ